MVQTKMKKKQELAHEAPTQFPEIGAPYALAAIADGVIALGTPVSIAELLSYVPKKSGNGDRWTVSETRNEIEEPSKDEQFKLPDRSVITADEIVNAIQNGGGPPFEVTMADIQEQMFGFIFSTVDPEERPTYEKFYREFRKALDIIQTRFGGQWVVTINEDTPRRIYTLAPTKTTVVQSIRDVQRKRRKRKDTKT